MMRLNRKVEYALIALRYMSEKKPGQLSSAKEISEKYGSPFDATSRVLQIMAQSGILKSEHGAQGGYQIVKDLGRVPLLQLNEIIMGPLGVTKCISRDGGESCELVSTCNIMTPVRNLNARLNEFFKNMSVAEILGGVRETDSAEETLGGQVQGSL